MTAKWGSCAILAICLSLLFGCRTLQPNVKPDSDPERFASPPEEGRYERPGYPKAAYDAPIDPVKRNLDAKGGMPSMGRGGGMPGMGSGSGRY